MNYDSVCDPVVFDLVQKLFKLLSGKLTNKLMVAVCSAV